MQRVRLQPELRPVSGGDASIALYASDAVVTMPREATLHSVAEEFANDEIGLVVIGSKQNGRFVGNVSARDVLGAYTMSPT